MLPSKTVSHLFSVVVGVFMFFGFICPFGVITSTASRDWSRRLRPLHFLNSCVRKNKVFNYIMFSDKFRPAAKTVRATGEGKKKTVVRRII